MLDKILSMEEQNRRISFRRIRKYLTMMARGVAFLHKHGISHLDLSLENMLLTSNDEIRICDFGQAQEKRFFESFTPRRGKLGYMCPEVYKLHSYDGFKADVWSLGVIFWSMLANGSLYEKPVSSDPHFAYVGRGKESIQKLLEGSGVTDVPLAALDLLSNMLSVNPSSRYTIDQVLRHSWLQDSKSFPKISEPVNPHTDSSVNSVISTSESPSQRHWESSSVFDGTLSGERTCSQGLRHMPSDNSTSSGSGASSPEQGVVSGPLLRSQTSRDSFTKKPIVKSHSAILPHKLPCTRAFLMKELAKEIH